MSPTDPSVIPESVVDDCAQFSEIERMLQHAYRMGRASAFDQVNSALHGRRQRFDNARQYEQMVRQQIGVG